MAKSDTDIKAVTHTHTHTPRNMSYGGHHVRPSLGLKKNPASKMTWEEMKLVDSRAWFQNCTTVGKLNWVSPGSGQHSMLLDKFRRSAKTGGMNLAQYTGALNEYIEQHNKQSQVRSKQILGSP